MNDNLITDGNTPKIECELNRFSRLSKDFSNSRNVKINIKSLVTNRKCVPY
jgi:hypothetical protein